MFTRTVVSASVVASALAGPIMMRRPTARDSISLGGSSLGGSSILSSGSSSDLFGGGVISNIWQVGNSEFDPSSISISDFSHSMSFDHFGGLSSFNGFDNFYGSDNFCGLSNTQTFVQSESVTCESQSVDIIQQQLAILGEYAKRVILSSICDVETQTVVLSQWIGTLQVFSSDIRHESVSREVTFDSHVASFISDICDSEGAPVYKDFGFSGTDIGSSCVSIEGLNWNSETSPASVSSAFSSCESAAGFSISPPTISSISSSCGSSCDLIPPSLSSSCDGSDCGSSSISSCDSSDCGSSISELPPSCDGSDCGSSVSELPPSCDGSDCGSSVSELPPSSSCDSSDCGSDISELPPSCDGSDCGSSDSIPPTCDGSDCSATEAPLAPPVETDSSGDVATLSDGSSDAAPTDDSSDLAPTDDSADSGAASAAQLTPVGGASVAQLTPVGAAAAAPTGVGSV